jgi:hypothetical protein
MAIQMPIRVLASLAAVTLGAAILLPTAAPAPAVTANESIQAIESAQPVESAQASGSAEPSESARSSETSKPTESQPRATTPPVENGRPASLQIDQTAIVGDSAYGENLLVLSGTAVTFLIGVYNTGPVTLHDITIDSDYVDLTDTECADPPDLEPRTEASEFKYSWLFFCEYRAVVHEGTTRNTTTVDSRETEPQTSTFTVYAYDEWPLVVSLTNDAPRDARGRPTAKRGDIVTFTVNYTITGVTAASGLLFASLANCLSYVDGSATNNDEFIFDGAKPFDEDLRPTWVADGVTKSGSVTFRVKIEKCAASKFSGRLVSLAYVDLALGWGSLYGKSSIYVARPRAPDTSRPTAPPTDIAGSTNATAKSS